MRVRARRCAELRVLLAFGVSVQNWLADARWSRPISIVMGLALAASVVFVAR